MNNVNLIGRLTHEPELRESKTGKKFTCISIAVGYGDNVLFINEIYAYDRMAETICKNVKKGENIGVSGRLFTTKKDNNSRLVVICDRITFCGKKNE